MFKKGRFVAALCLVALLGAALAPGASGLPCAVLVATAPLLEPLVATPLPLAAGGHRLSVRLARAGGSRAPPIG